MDIKRYLPLLILVCFLVYSFKDVSVFVDEISKFLIWVDSLGYIAPLVVFAIHSLAIMICFPLSIMFEWGSGFLFGLVGGSCIILLSKSFGALLCFVLGIRNKEKSNSIKDVTCCAKKLKLGCLRFKINIFKIFMRTSDEIRVPGNLQFYSACLPFLLGLTTMG